jgi:Methyltransferase domain
VEDRVGEFAQIITTRFADSCKKLHCFILDIGYSFSPLSRSQRVLCTHSTGNHESAQCLLITVHDASGAQPPLYLLPSYKHTSCAGAPYYGDGPKFVCGMEFLTEKADCLVYSIGSRAEDGFELDLLSRAPNCEVSISAAAAAVKHACRQYMRSTHSNMRLSSSSNNSVNNSGSHFSAADSRL